MPAFYVFTFVHCTAFYSPATEALINNNNNNNNNRPSAAGQTTHTVCIVLDGGRHAGREGPGRSKEGGGWEGGSKGMMGGGRDEAMMLGRERASMEEGRVE